MGAHDLLSLLKLTGVRVAVEGDQLLVQPSSRLTGPMRMALRDAKPELLALLSNAEIASDDSCRWEADQSAPMCDPDGLRERRAQLVRRGWKGPKAALIAERLAKRDREGDDRVLCAECAHYHRGRCANRRHAGLTCGDVGREWATRLQRCLGFDPAEV